MIQTGQIYKPKAGWIDKDVRVRVIACGGMFVQFEDATGTRSSDPMALSEPTFLEAYELAEQPDTETPDMFVGDE